MKKNITTLEEVEEEQRKLKIKMALAKQAFTKNLVDNRQEVKDFLIQNVAIPGGAIGLSFAAVKTVASFVNHKNEEEKEKEKNVEREEFSLGILEKLFPVLFGFAQAYVLKKLDKEDDADRKIVTVPANTIPRNTTLKTTV